MNDEFVDQPFDDSERGIAKPQHLQPPQRRPAATGVKEDVLNLDEGRVVLQWPSKLSKASAADLIDWLALIGRNIQRSADAPLSDESE